MPLASFTAQQGIVVPAGGVEVQGGVLSVTDGSSLDGYKIEEGGIDNSTQLNGAFNFSLTDGHIQKFIGATAGNYSPNFRVSGTTTLNSVMDTGDVATCTLMAVSTTHYLDGTSIQIDGSTANLDIDYVGGFCTFWSKWKWI